MSHQLIFNPPHNHYPYNEYEIQLLQHSHNPYEVKHRKRTSRFQLSVLEATFAENPRPSSAVKKQIAAQTNMSIRGIQVWFQNRRAKAKNQLLKGNNQPKVIDDHDSPPGQPISPTTPNIGGERASTPRASPNPSSDSNLAPPANLALRRGSAPAPLGNLPSYAFDASNQVPTIRSPQSSPTEEPSPLGYRKPFPPPPSATRLPSDHLARRRSLPAFHPEHQTFHQQRNNVSSAPSATQSYVPSSTHRLSTGPYPSSFGRFSIRNTNASSNHGGVYRSGSNPGPLQPPPPGSFKLPPVPAVWNNQSQDSTQPFQFGAQAEDPSNLPYTYAPRRVPDISSPGPLPQHDFSFGHQDEQQEHDGGPSIIRDSPGPMPESESIFEPPSLVNFTNPQSYRFGSMASIASSILSVDTDVSGTTGTTTASSAGNSLPSAGGAAALPLPGGFGLSRSRLPSGAGVVGNGGTFNPNFSFGSGNNALQPQNAVQYPTGFDADSRRASCPAHFVDRFSSLGVEQGQAAQTFHHQPFGSFAARKGYGQILKRSPSVIGPGFGLMESPPTSQGSIGPAVHHQRRQTSLSTSSVHENEVLHESNGWTQSNLLSLPSDNLPGQVSSGSTDARRPSYGSQHSSNSPGSVGGMSAPDAGGLQAAGSSTDRFSDGFTPPGKPSPPSSASTPTFMRATNDSRDAPTPNSSGIYPVFEGGFTHQLYAVSENEQCGGNNELYPGAFSLGSSSSSASPESLDGITTSGYLSTTSTTNTSQSYLDGTHDFATSDFGYSSTSPATFDNTNSYQQPSLYAQEFQYSQLPDPHEPQQHYALSSDPSQYHPSSLSGALNSRLSVKN